MPSIAELRSRLLSAQSSKAKARLSNLQCIDILLKVCKKNNVHLISSNDGMLFYTIEEVQNEVENELLCRGGRIAIFELNSVLNFQPDYIDRAIKNIVESTNMYINSHGIIISKRYLKNLMFSINDRIQECGTVEISELSNEYDLPFEMIKSNVSSNLGTVIKGNINGNLIESYTFEERKINNLKVSLLAITVPMLTHDISRIIKININTVNDNLQSMHKKGEIKGLLKGGEYIPQCYLDAVEKFLHNYYSRNGYVEVKLVKSFTHLDSKLLDKMFQNNIKLDSVYINKDMFEPVSILINEAISSKSWREVTSMLPSSLTQMDWNMIIGSIKNASKNGSLLENLYVTNTFKDDLVKYLVKDMDERKDKVEQFHKIFSDSNLGNDHLKECVELVLSQDKQDHFVDLYQIYPEQTYSMVEVDLKKDLLSMIVSSKKVTKSSAEKKIAKDNTDKLITHIMESEMSLKALEKVQFDSTNVILQFMAKELCGSVFNLLLEYYLINNKLVEGSVDVDPNKRNKMVELIVDDDVKSLFKSYTTHLKNKDAVLSVSTGRDLCKLMYINYNVKKDSRNFLRNKQSQYHQQLSSLTNLDSLTACYVCINLIFLKNNLYFHINDKLWCLKETLILFNSVLESSEHFKLIQSIVELVEKMEKGADQKASETDNRVLQDKTSELINAFKT